MNKKYILIVSFFLIINLLGLSSSSNFTTIVAPMTTIALIYYLFKEEFKSFDLNQVKDTYILKTLKFALIYQGIINWILILTFGRPTQSIVEQTMTINPLYPITTVFVAPIVEELIFRRIIFGSLQGSKQNFSVVAATISSLLFAVGHMNTYGFLGYFAVGMVFCYFYFKTKKLHTTIISHMIFNFLVVLVQSIHMAWSGT